MLQKNQTLMTVCERLGAEMEGVCHIDGQAVFVPGALPGEKVEVKIVQAKPRYAFARLSRLLSPSPARRDPPCPAYELCGGCSCQHMAYAETLAAKRAQVMDCLSRIGGLSLSQDDVPAVLGADDPLHGRNKTSLPVGGTADSPRVGFYRRRSHDIVPIADCPVSMPGLACVIEAVSGWMKENSVAPYDEERRAGLVRHVVARANRAGEWMVLLVATARELPHISDLIDRLRTLVPGFHSLHLSVNRLPGNVILGETSEKLFGADALAETLLGMSFEIAPLSFFQVNPAQTEKLYRTALDFAALMPSDLVVDAYAGAGTITLPMARAARRAVGIEIVPQAVESARRNALCNHVENVEFHVAAVEELLPALVAGGMRPDVLVLDPPRKGVEPAVVQAALAARPRRIVYVSCHAPTQARDVALLCEGGYRFVACQPVDMFCYAAGVENVVALERSADGNIKSAASAAQGA